MTESTINTLFAAVMQIFGFSFTIAGITLTLWQVLIGSLVLYVVTYFLLALRR